MKIKITTNVYKITFNSTWDGCGGRKAKAEFERIKTMELLGDNEKEAIKNLSAHYKNTNVLGIEKVDTYTYYEEIDQENY